MKLMITLVLFQAAIVRADTNKTLAPTPGVRRPTVFPSYSPTFMVTTETPTISAPDATENPTYSPTTEMPSPSPTTQGKSSKGTKASKAVKSVSKKCSIVHKFFVFDSYVYILICRLAEHILGLP